MYLGWVVCLERCSQFCGDLIERFHCMYVHNVAIFDTHIRSESVCDCMYIC